jgi:hypothetical protein
MSRYDESEALEQPQQTRNFFNALLFPANLTGLGHIVIYTVCFALLNLVRSAMIGLAGIAVGFIGLIVTIEMINYLHHCIRESASGATSAPDSMFINSFDCGGVSATLGGYFSLHAEYVSMIFPAIICFLPGLLYLIFTERVDHIFIILLSAGAFYFPMLLMAVVIFDSSSGYNPFIHIISIIRTFFSYCLLVLQEALVIAAGIYLVFLFRNSVLAAIFLFPIQMYLIMVMMHLLGRFYYLHQDKLNWDV